MLTTTYGYAIVSQILGALTVDLHTQFLLHRAWRKLICRRYPEKNEASPWQASCSYPRTPATKSGWSAGVGQGLDESIMQGGGVPLSDMAGSVALSAISVR